MPIFSNADTSETGAQQMLLDTQAIITILLDIPNLGRHTSTASYTKFVTREMSKAKALLKILLQIHIVHCYQSEHQWNFSAF
ncbi:hypothetical protein LWI28_023798 [Acer negundo]|uniref:Vps53 C-terminal domain-containing protein n=1 Tax=Acer negundo TaxID=4023 RepID=A0AAD5JBJ2_ACENE|nr:hypothetical protein LWI28_023798 [Acer negundo]